MLLLLQEFRTTASRSIRYVSTYMIIAFFELSTNMNLIVENADSILSKNMQHTTYIVVP